MLMNSYSVHFRFSQHFDFLAEEAYKWCTDYDSGDIVFGWTQELPWG